MSEIFEKCKELFQADNLYAVLSIDKNATAVEIKKAYYRTSLKCHPDRTAGDLKQLATIKFQLLGKVYYILSNPEKRKIYDDTGELEDNIYEGGLGNIDWNNYWRNMFKKITTEDIMDFESKYKGSEEELADLKEAYLSSEGDITVILNNVLCSFAGDEERFTDIINEWVKNKEVPSYEKFENISKKQILSRKRKAKKEEKEAEMLKQELGMNSNSDSLVNLIQARHQDRQSSMDSFYDTMLQKCGKQKNTNKKTKK